jgi:hypothetical protein
MPNLVDNLVESAQRTQSARHAEPCGRRRPDDTRNTVRRELSLPPSHLDPTRAAEKQAIVSPGGQEHFDAVIYHPHRSNLWCEHRPLVPIIYIAHIHRTLPGGITVLVSGALGERAGC